MSPRPSFALYVQPVSRHKGPIVRVVVNGKQALNADLATVAEERNAHSGVRLTSGYIAFQADRKVEIKELKSRTTR